jgi:hypothetical protein
MAREKLDEARKLWARDIDPSAEKKALKVARVQANEDSFEAIAREWFSKFSPQWAENHSSKIIRRLERDVFPWIGARPIAEVGAPELLTTMRRIEARGAIKTAHRVLQNCGQIFRYAIATDHASRDPAVDLRGALPPSIPTYHASITDPKASAHYCASSLGTKEPFRSSAHCDLPRLCLFAPANCAKLSGRSSI